MYPRALVHRPLQYGGLDIPQLYMEQLFAHVHTILRYGLHCEDLTGYSLHVTGEAMQLEVGYRGERFAAPLCLKDNVTNSWLKHVWISTQECNVNVLMDFVDYTSQRHGNMEIMRLFVQQGLKQPQLYTLNQCWMFLKVFWVTNICWAQETTLFPNSGIPASQQNLSLTGLVQPDLHHRCGLCGNRCSFPL